MSVRDGGYYACLLRPRCLCLGGDEPGPFSCECQIAIVGRRGCLVCLAPMHRIDPEADAQDRIRGHRRRQGGGHGRRRLAARRARAMERRELLQLAAQTGLSVRQLRGMMGRVHGL